LPLLILVIFIGAVCALFFEDSGMPRPFWGASLADGYNIWFWLALFSFSFNYLLAFQSYGYLVHWAVLWSLSVEEQFYIFFPLVLRKLGNDLNLSRFLAALIFISFFLRGVFYLYDPATMKRFITCMMLFDQIAVGVLLYLNHQKFQKILSDHRGLSFLVAAAGLLLLAGTYLLTSADNPRDLIWSPTLLAFGLFGFLLGGLHFSFFDAKYLKLFSLPGKYCYGGYLLHSWVLHFIRHPLMKMNPLLGFALLALATTLVSGLSYHFFEMPANRLIRAKFGVQKAA
jgi:peptidoglycan/LPS O-acetylase OafA/YrhL